MPWRSGDRDADWWIEPGESTAAVVALYRDEVERSRAAVVGAGWGDRAKRPGRNETLGWILSHMVEEVARHNGHADILREAIDGVIGE